MRTASIWRTSSWLASSFWRWSSAALARRCRATLNSAGGLVLDAVGLLATGFLLVLGCVNEAWLALARFLPPRGARGCRVPGWRPTPCDTARLERVIGWSAMVSATQTNMVHLTSKLACGHHRTDAVAASMPLTVASEMPCPECRRRAEAARQAEDRRDAGA